MNIGRTLREASRVAVYGASDDSSKPGGRVLRYLADYGYRGTVTPVHPVKAEVQGLPALRSLQGAGQKFDVAVIAVGRSAVEACLADAVKSNVPIALLFASGFAELGTTEGTDSNRVLQDVLRDGNTRLLGPNTNGLVISENRLTLTFMSGLGGEGLTLYDEGISLVTQSGAMGGFLLKQALECGIGLGTMVATGNEVDLTNEDVIADLLEHGSGPILSYYEGIKDPATFEANLKLAREKNIPLVVLKVGTSDQGAVAATSHTGSVVGNNSVVQGVLDRYRIPRAESMEALLASGHILSSAVPPSNASVSLITFSGAAGILATDLLHDNGLDLAEWSRSEQDHLAAKLPDFASTSNPIDLTGQLIAEPDLLRQALRATEGHEPTGCTVFIGGNLPDSEEEFREILREFATNASKPLVVVWIGATPEALSRFRKDGLVAYGDVDTAIRSIGHLVRWHLPSQQAIGPKARDSEVSAENKGGLLLLDEFQGKTELAQYGVDCIDEEVFMDVEEISRKITIIDRPLVVKALSAEIAHKSEHQLVATGLNSRSELIVAAEGILTRARLLDPKAKLLIQDMVDGDTELLLGMKVDAVFGRVIVLGIGGLFVEVIRDVAVRTLPVTEADAKDMVHSLKHRDILQGARGRTPADLDALAAFIAAFSDCVADHPDWDTAELNPVIIENETGRPVAVDCVVGVKSDYH